MKRRSPKIVIAFRCVIGVLAVLASYYAFHFPHSTPSFLNVMRLVFLPATILILAASWVRSPWAAGLISGYAILLPLIFDLLLWRLVLKTSSLWEFLITLPVFLAVPVGMSWWLFTSRDTRRYYRIHKID